MIAFAFFYFGLLIGIVVWSYITLFPQHLSESIEQNFREIYPASLIIFGKPHSLFQLKTSALTQISAMLFSISFAVEFATLFLYYEDSEFTLWLGLLISIMTCLCIIDWQYQLVSPNLCLLLFFLGLFAAKWQFISMSIEQSLQSAVIFFAVFYAIYWIAKCYHGQEMLGRGDCWLMLGIGSFTPYQLLPQMLFYAAIAGIIFILIKHRKNANYSQFVPFVPFLCLARLMLAFGLDYFI